MKAENLTLLRDNGFPVPAFTVVTGETADLSFSEADRFAVRSTFDGEDTEGTSFAGQFDTLLNVPREDVPDAVRKVRASYEGESIAAYRGAMGTSSSERASEAEPSGSTPALAPVLVQEMVDADLAGVAFSANPTGLLNEAVVVVGRGLGDAVVEDRADTTTYYYNKDDKLSYYETDGDAPLLDPEVLTDLVDLVERVEALYGRPMDVEYAIEGGKVFLLQARPITTLHGTSPTVLDSSNIVESYPGLTLPLSQSFAKDIYYEIFKALLTRATGKDPILGTLDDALKDMVAMANGRVYYRITSWYDVLKLMPFSKKVTGIWQDMLGVENREVSSDVDVPLRTKATMVRTVLKFLKVTPQEMDDLETFYNNYSKGLRDDLSEISAFSDHVTNEADRRAADVLKVRELLKEYHALKDDIIPRWDITLVNDMYAFLYTAFAGEKNKAQLSNLSDLESMKPAKAMEALAGTARAHGMDSDEYRAEKAQFIDAYGDRCLGELKLETKTYRTDPSLVDAYVEQELRSGTGTEAPATSAAPEGNAPAASEENVSRNPFVKRAKVGIRNRETSRMNRTRLYGIARTIFTEAGKALADLGLLETSEDVFYLYISELEDYVYGGETAESAKTAGSAKTAECAEAAESADLTDAAGFKALVKERKRLYEGFAQLPAYSRLVFDGPVRDKQVSRLHTTDLAHADELAGLGASLGKATGEVLVVEAPDLTLDTTGKVLVTHSTDPGWVFLIRNAAAIVAEKGSLLSHTAIITRELGKPAVVGVKDATRILKTGDLVEVDADTGVVKVLNKEDTP